LLKQDNKKGSEKELPVLCSKWRIVYGEKVVGKIEALGLVGRCGSFFEAGGYCNVKSEPTGTPQGEISTKGGAPENGDNAAPRPKRQCPKSNHERY
jgi:hypothetical protein